MIKFSPFSKFRISDSELQKYETSSRISVIEAINLLSSNSV